MYSVDAAFGKTLFVLGGARSGKSRHAQAIAEQAASRAVEKGAALVYVATAQAFDDEMTDRIARHRLDRDDRWRTVDAPIALADALSAADAEAGIILVDCLTLWLTNLLLGGHDIEARTAELLTIVAGLDSRVIFVSNEVGMGIVPDNALARRFRDEAGRLHQRVAAHVDSVDMVIAGLIQRWKGPVATASFPR